jgi:hypothetical protein
MVGRGRPDLGARGKAEASAAAVQLTVAESTLLIWVITPSVTAPSGRPKPFKIVELVAWIHALPRRSGPALPRLWPAAA